MLSMDSTTRAAYDAAATADARAQAVLDALTGTVDIKVYNGSGTVVGSGTIAAPWATRSANVLTVQQTRDFTVTTGGTPDSTWYLRLESAGKWVKGTFGLTGSGADFLWSLSTWAAGQLGTIGTATGTAPKDSAYADLTTSYSVAGAQLVLAWNVPSTYTIPGGAFGTAGGQIDLWPYLNIPQGQTPILSVASQSKNGTPGSFGVTVGTRYVTVPASLGVGTYDVSINLGAQATPGISDATAVLWQSTPTMAFPAKYVWQTDPVYGTQVRRLTDPTDIKNLPDNSFGADAAVTYRTAPEYSELRSYNCDLTMFMVSSLLGTVVFDYATGAAITTIPQYQPYLANFRWHPTVANRIICIGNDANLNTIAKWPAGWQKHNELVAYTLDIDKAARTWNGNVQVVGSFGGTGAERVTTQRYMRGNGDGGWACSREEIAIDSDTGDIWMAFAAQTYADSLVNPQNAPGDVWYFAYNLTQNTVGAEVANSAINPTMPTTWPDHVGMVPGAKRLLMSWSAGRPAAARSGYEFYNRSTMALELSYRDAANHASYLYASDGSIWMVKGESVYAPNGYGIYAYRIDGTTQFVKKLLNAPYLATANHNCGLHTMQRAASVKRDFTVLSNYTEHDSSVSMYEYSGTFTATPQPFSHEIVMVYLDSTPEVPHVLRLVSTNSAGDYYWGGQPHAVIAPDASRVMYATNWKNGNSWATAANYGDKYTVSYTFEVEIPSAVVN